MIPPGGVYPLIPRESLSMQGRDSLPGSGCANLPVPYELRFAASSERRHDRQLQKANVMQSRRRPSSWLALAIAAIEFLSFAVPAPAAFVLGKPEVDAWSDMAFPLASGSFNAGSKTLSISSTPSNDLELGSLFGPSNPGRHYGTGGTLGGAFSATLTVSGVVIQPTGTVTSPGSVSIKYNGGAPGSIGTDYGIVPGTALLTGSVLEVLLDATGSGTLDVLFAVTGGALQNMNFAAGTNFAPANRAILRLAGRTPSGGDFSTGFSLSGSSIDVLGLVPEFPYTTLIMFMGILGVATTWRTRFAERERFA